MTLKVLVQEWAKCGPHAALGFLLCGTPTVAKKRLNVRPFKKSRDTWIFQISFAWLRVLTSANSCFHRWMLLRINCEIDWLKTTWCVSYEQVSTATLCVSTTFNSLPIESSECTSYQIVTVFSLCLWQSHIDVDLCIIVTIPYGTFSRPSPFAPKIFWLSSKNICPSLG